MIILSCFLILGCWVLVSLVFWSIRTGISPMPSSPAAKKAVMELLKGHSIQGDIYELGAGWGTLAFPLASLFPHSTVIAIERSPLPYFICKMRQQFSKLSNITYVQDDFFRHNLSSASLVVCYLYPGAMSRLKGKFEEELKPGTLIVSNTFAIPGWKPVHTLHLPD